MKIKFPCSRKKYFVNLFFIPSLFSSLIFRFFFILMVRFFNNHNKQLFFILSSKRSGSNYLVSQLNSHSSIKCYGEIFLFSDLLSYIHMRFLHLLFLLRTFCQKTTFFKDKSARKHRKFKTHSIGFKVFYPQLIKNRWVLRFLSKNYNFKMIHLIRKNILRKYLSFIIVKKTHIWVSLTNCKLEKIYIDCDKLLYELDNVAKEATSVAKMFNCVDKMTIYYEDLCKNKDKELEKIQKFLGVPVRKLSSNLVKQNPFPIKDMVENYDELEKTLRGTKYYWMLES